MPMMEYNHDKSGGTEYMARRWHSEIYPDMTNIREYDCYILPGQAPVVGHVNGGKPVIIWLHNPLDQLPPEASDLFEDEEFLSILHLVVVVSEWLKAYMVQFTKVPAEKIVVIPNAVDPVESDLTRFDKRVERPVIVHASRQNRAMEILIPALHALDQDFELKIFNDFYPDTSPLEGIEDVVLDPRFTYYGETPRATVMKYMAEAHIHAHPAYWRETSCIVQIEAMSAGLLTVVSNVAALPETSLGHAMVVPFNGPEDRDQDIQNYIYSMNEAISIVKNGLWSPKDQVTDTDDNYSWPMAWIRWTSLDVHLPVHNH
jgi:glycosyltransferase involved in cell wall biosynthesis